MNKKKLETVQFVNDVKKMKARIKTLRPEYEKYSSLFHSKAEVEGLYQTLSVFAGQNDLDIVAGLPAPTFSAPNENSEIISLEKNGNAKALLFLAHWCGYCQKELPIVQNLINTVGVPNGVEVIAVATAIDRGRENYPPQKWLADEGWSELQLYDLEREIGAAYGLNAFPYWVFLDKDLNVVARQTGNIPENIVLAQLFQLANQ